MANSGPHTNKSQVSQILQLSSFLRPTLTATHSSFTVLHYLPAVSAPRPQALGVWTRGGRHGHPGQHGTRGDGREGPAEEGWAVVVKAKAGPATNVGVPTPFQDIKILSIEVFQDPFRQEPAPVCA